MHTNGLAATAVLRLAACHQQQVIGPGGFRAGWCVEMSQSYPIISSGAVAIEQGSEAYQLLLHLIPQHTCLAALLVFARLAAVLTDRLTRRNAAKHIESIHDGPHTRL